MYAVFYVTGAVAEGCDIKKTGGCGGPPARRHAHRHARILMHFLILLWPASFVETMPFLQCSKNSTCDGQARHWGILVFELFCAAIAPGHWLCYTNGCSALCRVCHEVLETPNHQRMGLSKEETTPSNYWQINFCSICSVSWVDSMGWSDGKKGIAAFPLLLFGQHIECSCRKECFCWILVWNWMRWLQLVALCRVCAPAGAVHCGTRFGCPEWCIWSKTCNSGNSFVPSDFNNRYNSSSLVFRTNLDRFLPWFLYNDSLGCCTLRLVYGSDGSCTQHCLCCEPHRGVLHSLCCNGDSSWYCVELKNGNFGWIPRSCSDSLYCSLLFARISTSREADALLLVIFDAYGGIPSSFPEPFGWETQCNQYHQFVSLGGLLHNVRTIFAEQHGMDEAK